MANIQDQIGIDLKHCFGRNSPVTKIIRVEITVCANTIRNDYQ